MIVRLNAPLANQPVGSIVDVPHKVATLWKASKLAASVPQDTPVTVTLSDDAKQQLLAGVELA